VTSSKCTMAAGAAACTGNYPTSPTASSGPWFTGSTDTRACSACQCGFTRGPCTGHIAAYSDGSCSTNPFTVGDGSLGSVCNLPFAPLSGKVIGTPIPQTCEVQTYPSGALTATGPQTVCCR
jgi:hypothetical protein